MTTIYKVSCASICKDGCEEEYFTNLENAQNRVTQLLNRDLDKELQNRKDIALKTIKRDTMTAPLRIDSRLLGRVKRTDIVTALSRWFRLESIVTKD